jgi:GAF domain-containing protein
MMAGAIPPAPWEEFARQPESVYCADTQHDLPYETIRRVMAAEHIRSFLAVPLLYQGQLAGVLMLVHEAPRAYSVRDLAFADLLGGQIAVAVDSKRVRRHDAATRRSGASSTAAELTASGKTCHV